MESSPKVLASTQLIFILVDPQAMGVGQMFGEHLYTIMSNAGVLIFVITILQLMNEVDKDMVANDEVASFLVQVARKGDEIRVFPSPEPEERGHLRGEEEEKREEICLAVLTGSETNNVYVDPEHDRESGRTGSALNEMPDQNNGSNQYETIKKKADETIDENSLIKSMPFKVSDVENGPSAAVVLTEDNESNICSR
jgi:hypothetical protein